MLTKSLQISAFAIFCTFAMALAPKTSHAGCNVDVHLKNSGKSILYVWSVALEMKKMKGWRLIGSWGYNSKSIKPGGTLKNMKLHVSVANCGKGNKRFKVHAGDHAFKKDVTLKWMKKGTKFRITHLGKGRYKTERR